MERVVTKGRAKREAADDRSMVALRVSDSLEAFGLLLIPFTKEIHFLQGLLAFERASIVRDAADGDLVSCVDILRHGDVLSVADAYPLAVWALDPGAVLVAQRRAFDGV